MAGVVRGDGTDSVDSATGTGSNCGSPKVTSTDVCSTNVFVNGIGVVREDDLVKPHPKAGCGTDTSVITVFSGNVFVNNKGIARNGDKYTSDNVITSGSSNVFANQ